MRRAFGRYCFLLSAAAAILFISSNACADTAQLRIDGADTAWLLISAALVFFMMTGLAFFYGGLVRKKNVLSILMQCFMIICLITLQWMLVGYSLAFGPDIKGMIGSLAWAGLRGVGLEPSAAYAPTVPHIVFMIYQAMFAVITPALILGAFAERMRFDGFCVLIILWSTLIYDPIAHWLWGNGGFLRAAGALDFAGGMVVHVSAGVAALAAALYLGRRQGYPKRISPPHNLPFAVLGAGMLWFGWFGFNAGSALSIGPLAASAFVATHAAGAAAGLTWAVLDHLFNERPTMLGMITGAVGGLAAVTPASGFVSPWAAVAIGVVVSLLSYGAVTVVKLKFGYDDSLDVFGVHGVGGMWGSLATGLFASTAVNPAGANGWLHGNPGLLWIQFKAVVITGGYSLAGTFALLWLVDTVLGLRVSEQEEQIGLDLVHHREVGYTLLD
ncbi:MAG TPA: ammonium transporter [Elusimicrobiota bacterium]|nr:ammonium transporter [Elusimicrobiota bacterium]